MKLHTLLIAVCLFIFTPPPSFGSSDRNQVHLHSIRADFVQEKHLKILVQPLISTGFFAFQAPRSLRWEYLTPVPSIMLMHNGKLSKYTKTDGQFTEQRGMGVDSMQFILGEISNWLDGRFSKNEMFTASFPDEQTILLKPRDQTLAGLISSIELKRADQRGILDTITIFEGTDSYTRMTFSNAVINKNIPAALFSQK